MTSRKLEVGPDGKANVLILGNPIPRALSIVSWGANDIPAVSWKDAAGSSGTFKTASEAHLVLRSPPSADVIKVDEVTQDSITAFTSETLSALRATTEQVLGTPLTPAERASRIHALHSQAGARVAAFASAISAVKLRTAVRTYKSATLEMPKPPSQSTLNGELDRRSFMGGMEQASAFITDKVLTFIKDPGTFKTPTEAILATFGQVGQTFSQWAASMPAGVVGVPQAAPTETENAAGDEAIARRVLNLMRGMLGETSHIPSTTENSMLTLTQLSALADQDPKGFWDVCQKAFTALSDEDRVSISQKFEWGENGVAPHDPSGILAEIPGIQGQTPILGMILSAVTGIDINAAARDNVQVATMRSAPTAASKAAAAKQFQAQVRTGLMDQVAKEIEANPAGALALEVKKLVAPDVAEAVKQAVTQVFKSIGASSGIPDDGGAFAFQADQADMDTALKAHLPSFNNFRE